MDLTKHTPGPWSFRPTGTWPNTNHHLGIYADSVGVAMPEVAKVEGCGSVSAANARLIAAAPDMLDALRKAEAILSQSYSAMHGIMKLVEGAPQTSAALTKLAAARVAIERHEEGRKAIAKATA